MKSRSLRGNSMTITGRRLRGLVLASAFMIPAQAGFGQATPETANIAQPHLAKARAEAFGENGWKFAALITCYPNEGQSAEHVIKDPGPAKAADNLAARSRSCAMRGRWAGASGWRRASGFTTYRASMRSNCD